MASKPADHTKSNSGRDSNRESRNESISKPDDQTRDPNEIFEDDVTLQENPVSEPELSGTGDDEPLSAPSAATENSEDIGDEELLEMLEQLSETIDSAHNVLAEQQAHSPEIMPAEQNIALEEQPHGLEEQVFGLQEPASDLEEPASVLDFPLPPPLPGTPDTKRSIVPALATIFSVIFGFAALAALWFFWNSPDNSTDIDLAKGQDRFSGSDISRSVKSEERAPSQASIPAKTAAPLQPSVPSQTRVPLQSQASTATAPAPTPATEPVTAPDPVKPPETAVKPAETAKPVIEVTKEQPVRRVKTTALYAPSTPAEPAAPATELAKTEPEPTAQTPAPVESVTEPVKPALEVVKEQPVVAALPVKKAPTPPSISTAEAAPLLKRGRDLQISGDVASARLVYEYAAHRGSADAMYALAQTYDVEVLASWNVYGIEPDAKIALEWYGRAAQEGHDGADARASELEKLSNR